MPVLKGGDLKKTSGSGVMIDGKTLEEHVEEEEARELGEEFTPEKLPVYHKFRGKYSEGKGKREPSRLYTRREINAKYWERNMENQKTIDGVIAALLLSGREISGRELMNNCVRSVSGCSKKKYSTRSTYLFHKTDFGKFITSRRDGKGASYKLVSAALELKPEELLVFAYKDKKRDIVLEHHVGLKPYLETKEEKVKRVKKDKEETPPVEHGGVVELPNGNKLATSITTAVSQALGVNVNVSGRIEIVFKLE